MTFVQFLGQFGADVEVAKVEGVILEGCRGYLAKALGVSALVWPVLRPDSPMQRLDSLLYAESDAWSKQAELLVLV